MKRIMLVIGVLSLLLVSACSTQESSEVTLSSEQIAELCASVNTVDETGVGEGAPVVAPSVKIKSIKPSFSFGSVDSEACVCYEYPEGTWNCDPADCG